MGSSIRRTIFLGAEDLSEELEELGAKLKNKKKIKKNTLNSATVEDLVCDVREVAKIVE